MLPPACSDTGDPVQIACDSQARTDTRAGRAGPRQGLPGHGLCLSPSARHKAAGTWGDTAAWPGRATPGIPPCPLLPGLLPLNPPCPAAFHRAGSGELSCSFCFRLCLFLIHA